MTALLRAEGLGKHYGGVIALEDTDFTVHGGSIHGVLGKNGAGKSTLLSILAGHVAPTTGRVVFGEVDVTEHTLSERRAVGIRLLDQHTQVIPHLTVAENLLTPNLPTRRGLVDWRRVRSDARELLDRFELNLDSELLVGRLGVADQRKLNIVKALAGQGRLIMLDEPTTALTYRERQALFDWVRQLRSDGRAFVFISHYSQEVRELCDEHTVLRDARVVSTGGPPGNLSPGRLSEAITGAEVAEYHRVRGKLGEPVLEVTGLHPRGCAPVDLTVRAGEVIGLVGLAGSGAAECARSLAGLHPHTISAARVVGRPSDTDSVAAAAASGILYLTNDRLGEGLVPRLSSAENTHLGYWPRRGAFLDRPAMRSNFARYRDKLSLGARNHEQPARELSGGNQQKLLLARLLQQTPKVLILHEPTLGVDVKAKQEVHQIIDEIAESGVAILLLAYDADELVALSDRAMVFRDGAVVTEIDHSHLGVDSVHAALEAAA